MAVTAAAASRPRNRPLLPPPTLGPPPPLPLLCLLQVFYHLGDLDDALTYALGAGSLFDVNGSGEYVQTILGECCERHMCGTGARQLLL